ncbi:34-kDa subunit of RNA polymerase III (C) [Peltigera leucophlebia]|nr:34-kDa subunit of RNA polymerase III (C) [Peltigera leucophlebia]
MANQEDPDAEMDVSVVSSPKMLKNALYARCANLPAESIFSQDDLLSLDVIPGNDLEQLLSCTRQLTKEGLFKLMSKDGRACWKVVKRDDAAKCVKGIPRFLKNIGSFFLVFAVRYKSLSAEEALVYSYIESSGREGTWTRILRARTNLHPTVMNRCLKHLEKINYIKPIKSVKFPGRKTYMLAHLQPSDDVTGGPYYTDGVLDEEFVHQLGCWAEKYVASKSWSYASVDEPEKRKNKNKLSAEQAQELRAVGLEIGSTSERRRTMLPMPPGYMGYPTIHEITKAINQSGLSGVTMKEAEMKQLLDVLVWDGKLHTALNGKAYKSSRMFEEYNGDSAGNGLTESPCGRCPVADICEEGGPVDARTCEYFQEWLEI